MAIKYGISFAPHDECLTSLLINEFLETSRKDIEISRKMKKKKRRRKKMTQVTDIITITNLPAKH